jgi:DNA-binding NarL/FixJ family response regulator
MPPIRVVVALPQLMRSLVTAMLGERTDMTVVSELDDHRGVAATARRLNAAVAVVGGDFDAQACRDVLDADPHLELVVICDDGRCGFLCDLVTRVRAIGTLAADPLVDAITLGARSDRNDQAELLLPTERN